jgi:Pyruvate/2-oxoacid:ferredoxin oxidoreductase gamma subunit
MFQVRFHGRGGQGVVTAAELLASAGNRAQLDAAVGVKSVERFLEDEALRKGWQISRRRGADG